jgi:hypothetical protein
MGWMRRAAAALPLVVLFALPTNAQGVTDPRQWVEGALKVYMERRGSGLYDLLMKDTAIGHQSPKILEKNRSKIESEFDAMGVPHSTEFVNESDLGPSLKKVRYLIKYRRLPLLVEFTFYKFDRTWDVVHFAYEAGDDVWNKIGRTN